MPDKQENTELARCAETGDIIPHNEIVRVSGPGLAHLGFPEGATISASIIRQYRMIHRIVVAKRKQQAEIERRLKEEDESQNTHDENLPNI